MEDLQAAQSEILERFRTKLRLCGTKLGCGEGGEFYHQKHLNGFSPKTPLSRETCLIKLRKQEVEKVEVEAFNKPTSGCGACTVMVSRFLRAEGRVEHLR